MGERVGLAPAEALHVLQKSALLAAPQRPPADLVPRGAQQDRLVDVGDVLRVPQALFPRLEEAREHVEDDEGAGVAEVGRVVGRYAADVHRRDAGSRLEGKGAAPPRVVEP